MFGYVNIYKPELKMKDFYKYKAYYCGLCNTLKQKYGLLGQMTLSYDMTFLIILLSSLYERDTKSGQSRCVLHPMKKHGVLQNEFTDYVAAINIALTYYHLLDDWQDDKSIPGLAGTKVLKNHLKKISKQYPRQCNTIQECLARLQVFEKRQETDLDLVSRCFGELMGELLVYREDVWEKALRKMGFFLGKYIYLLDAYDDIEKDKENHNYNPLFPIYELATFETDCQNMLTMMMAECTKEFEKLPCLADADILRNILYMGVWTKHDTIKNDRLKRKEQENDSKPL
jgi:hypothetical protein